MKVQDQIDSLNLSIEAQQAIVIQAQKDIESAQLRFDVANMYISLLTQAVNDLATPVPMDPVLPQTTESMVELSDPVLVEPTKE